jgi:hypothetical protein
VKDVSKKHYDHAAFRRLRMTWILVMASAMPLYALPLKFQVMYEARGWPPYYEVGQTTPDELWQGTWWLREVAPCWALLAIAAVVPRWLHTRWLSRMNLPVVEGALGPVMSYRRPVERQFLVHECGVRAIVAAYCARLATVLVLVTPALVLAYFIASPVRSFGTIMAPTLLFSSPAEYLPVLVAATGIVLLNAPTEARLLGRHTAAFRAGVAGPP